MSHFLVIEARYYTEYNDALLKGVANALGAAGATHDVLETSGAYELPATLNFALHSKKHYDGYILLGCVIRGQTTHYDQILDAIFPKILDLSVAHDLALGMGVLTVENDEQAAYRADPDKKDYGGAAAKAALKMVDIKRQLLA